MSDDGFFREVDEELRSDRVKQFWDRFGSLIIIVAVVVVVGTAAWRAWEWYGRSQAAEAGDTLLQASRLEEEQKPDEAEALLRPLVDGGPGAYPNMARMKLAALVAEAQPDEAIALFDAVANDTSADPEQRAISRLRAGLLLVDHGSVADVESRLLQLAGPTNAYRSSAREGLGLAYWKAGDREKAFTQFSAIADDQAAPRNLAQRAGVMLDLIAGAGGPKREAPGTDADAEAVAGADVETEEAAPAGN